VGVGYDVNCGMRLIRADLTLSDVKPRLDFLMTELFRKVPAGVGSKGSVRLNRRDFDEVMRKGAKWCVEHGYGWMEDLERIEERGCIGALLPWGSAGSLASRKRARYACRYRLSCSPA